MKYPHSDVYTRLKKSKVHGIGVFAIIDIPKGTYLFVGDNSEMYWFSVDELNFNSMPKPIQKLYKDFCVYKTEDGINKIGCPSSFNNMPISWFLNNSESPNVICDKEYNFYTSRKIKKGEELTVNYKTYSK
jgi:SET domain-containing protein